MASEGAETRVETRLQRVDAMLRSPALRRVEVGDLRGYRMRRLLAVTDAAALVFAWLAAATLLDALGRRGFTGAESAVLIVFIPVWVLLGMQMGLYHRVEKRLDPSIADAAGIVIMILTAWSWLYLLARASISPGDANPVLPAVMVWAFAIASVLLFRVAVRTWARRRPWFTERVAIVGGPVDSGRIRRRLERHPEYGLEPVEEREIPYPECADDEVAAYAEFQQAMVDLLTEAEEKGIARVMVATSPGTVRARSDLLGALHESGIQVDLVAGDPDTVVPEPFLNYVEGLPVMSVPVLRRHKLAWLLKRGMDFWLASCALATLSPLLLYCAVRIKLGSPGPVFFKQERLGKDRVPFELFKFRSMVADADEQKDEVAMLNIHASTDDPNMFKVPGDPRVTKFGAFMRRWSIDELPQLINVVKGEMSLVGPRPLIPQEANLITGRYEARFKIRPGVTGAWQAQGRSDIGFEDMLKLDYTYVKSWTFKEDLKLILRTVEVIVQGRGAY